MADRRLAGIFPARMEASGRPAVLLLERDGVTCDRVRQLVRAEGGSTCAVDSADLFHALRQRLPFDLFAVGVERPGDLAELKLPADLRPLALLVPSAARAAATHYSVVLPGAVLIERRLSDTDALRRLLRPGSAAPAARRADDPVREAFAPFGLSERQLEVLERALLGDTAPQIAARLYISEVTVRNHLHAIYERVGVSGRRELQGRLLRGLLES
jgi:DNA-binding CsgD family transcriptional regulator